MGILNFFKNKDKNEQHENRNNSINTVEVNNETGGIKKENFPILIQETAFSRKYEEKSAFFEYIDFKVAGTSHYQKDIKKAIKNEDEDSFSSMKNMMVWQIKRF